METFPFSILKEDYDNSGKSYVNVENCPATIAFKRQFPDRKPATLFIDWEGGSVCELTSPNSKIGVTEHLWSLTAYEELKLGIEFHTTITFN